MTRHLDIFTMCSVSPDMDSQQSQSPHGMNGQTTQVSIAGLRILTDCQALLHDRDTCMKSHEARAAESGAWEGCGKELSGEAEKTKGNECRLDPKPASTFRHSEHAATVSPILILA